MGPSDPARRTLIIDPGFLGDTVFDGPLARALKARHPAGRVGIVVRPPSDRIAARMPAIDRIHIFDKRGKDQGLAGLRRIAAEIAQEAYDAAYVAHASPRSTLLARLARIPQRIGAIQGPIARLGLTERLSISGATFVGDRMELLGGSGPASLELKGSVAQTAAPRFGKRRVGLLLGSEWATKRWPSPRAKELVARLDPETTQLVFLGAPWEAPLYEALRALPAGLGAEDRLGGSLDELLDAIGTCELVIGGDTGPLHYARALGIPVIGLFGPTPERRHLFTPEDMVMTLPLDCRPCSAHGQDRCPLGHHRCLVDLTGDRVFGAVVSALEAQR